jgi:hypothetical protein
MPDESSSPHVNPAPPEVWAEIEEQLDAYEAHLLEAFERHFAAQNLIVPGRHPKAADST